MVLGEAGAARIKSGDYASWDRYDVDGILREMDHETHDTSGDYTSGGKSAGKSAGESAVQSAESENVSVEAAEARRAEALQPFSRLDAARDPNRGGGVGLGLSIASDIARSHGGELRLGESTALGGLKAELLVAR